jgi:two-component system sensor histidine kinase RpfC
MFAGLFRRTISPSLTQQRAPNVAERRTDVTVLPNRPFLILVAENNRAKQKVVAEIIEGAGHRAMIVEDSEAALDALDLRQFDLVLMNVNIPVMNGIDATKLYRFTSLGRPRVPIVALAAGATTELERSCKEAGIDACITEPIEPHRLLALIGMLVRDAGNNSQSASNTSEAAGYNSTHSGNRTSPATAVDLHILNELANLGGTEFVDELAAQFLENASSILRDLTEFMAAGDFQAFRKQVQALRSAASNIGARGIYETCLTLGQVAPENLAGRGETCLKELREEFERVCVVLQGRLLERNGAAGCTENTCHRPGAHAVYTE